MTWQGLSIVLTLASILAQAVAVDQVRAWGDRGRRSMARALRTAWWAVSRHRPTVHSASGTAHGHVTFSGSAYVIPADLSEALAGYMRDVNARIAQLSSASGEHGARLAELEARAERAEALAAEQAAEARLASGGVMAGAALAVLALLAQVLAA